VVAKIGWQMVKCWDLESNKVIRHYHGHLSGIYALRCVLVMQASGAYEYVFKLTRLLQLTSNTRYSGDRRSRCYCASMGYANKGPSDDPYRTYWDCRGREMPGV
jgi:hypothetical protein